MSKPSPYMIIAVDNIHIWDPLLPNLKLFREHLQLTQNQAAKTLGLSPRAYVGYENREKRIPWPVLLSVDYAYNHPKMVSDLLKRREQLRLQP